MQPTCGGGLARFRSAPATWLEAILLKEEEEDESQNNLTFTQLLSPNNAVSSTSSTPNNNSLFRTTQPQFLPDYYHASSPHTPTAANANNPFTQEVEHTGMALEEKMDKILEDSIPCRVRAKRGCATHPRSIAERVRRTRITDRIRKLQELVPNMDKQTNTADMLDEAVAYVKFLQKQIEELSEHQRRCTCMIQE